MPTTYEGQTVRVYVPVAVGHDLHSAVRSELVDAFGGVTSFDGHGSWESPDGSVITEEVRVYESVTAKNEEIIKTHSENIAKMVKRESDESAVMWEIRPTRYGMVQ